MRAEQTGPASAVVFDGEESICEIREARLVSARFRHGGRRIIGEEYPLPLYWMQYANHQDPERNTGDSPSLRIVAAAPDSVEIACAGKTRSGAVRSQHVLTVRSTGDPPAYTFEVRAELEIGPGKGWLVTPNASHGEVEFCNFWPDGLFPSDRSRPLQYDGCYLLSETGVRKIPLHHVETSDKHNIPLRNGDRMAWLLDNENPCLTFLSDAPAAAGICAYMWDAHLAYRVCEEDQPVQLTGPARLTAAFRLSSIGGEEAVHIRQTAVETHGSELLTVPAVVQGVHTFSVTCADVMRTEGATETWPWETAILEGDPHRVQFVVDRGIGFDDTSSVRIDAQQQTRACWMATTFGPAFRRPAFPDGGRFRLEARVRTALNTGSAGIALRIHRAGAPGLFDPSQYEVHRSPREVRRTSEWTRLVLLTPPISPAPDRLHILLELSGAGSCWFDNVQLTAET